MNFYEKVGGTFLLKVFGLGIAFIFQVILGRVLSTDMYGEFTIFVTYINLLSIIPILGMDRNLIKEIPKNFFNKQLLNFSIKTSIFLYVIILIFIYVFRPFINFKDSIFILFIIMLFIKILFMIFDGYLQGKGKILIVTFSQNVLNNIIKIILFFILLSRNYNKLLSAIISFVISEFIVLGFRFIVSKKELKKDKDIKIFDKFEKKLFIKYSITVALISGIGLLLQSVDKVMISKFLNFEKVGYYKVSQNYVNLISIFITPFVVFWPIISKYYHENKIEKIQNEMKKIVKLITYFVLPMFFVFFSIPERLLGIFGSEYINNEAKTVLIILAFSFLIDAISGPIGSILTMTKYAKLVLMNNIIALSLNITINIILVKYIGIIGIAIGTGISIIINNLLAIIEVKKLLGIFSYEVKNIFQIFIISTLNYFLSMIIFNNLNINNNILYVIAFVLILYFINFIFIILINKKLFFDFLNHLKKN